MKRCISLILTAVLTVLLTGCRAPAVRAEGSGALIRLERKSAGNLFILHPGDVALIDLVENPTTGYQWKFRIKGKRAVKITKDDYVAPKSSLCGAPGRRQFYLLARQPGGVLVEAELRRPWEKGQEPAEKLTFKLQVME